MIIAKIVHGVKDFCSRQEGCCKIRHCEEGAPVETDEAISNGQKGIASRQRRALAMTAGGMSRYYATALLQTARLG
jgi:hypothetical protein